MMPFKILILAVLAVIANHASATLIGDDITTTNIFDGNIFEGPTTVTADNTSSPELTDFGGLWDIDFKESAIHMTCAANNLFCGFSPLSGAGLVDAYLFEGLDWGGSGFLTNVALSGANNLGATVSLVSPTSIQLSYVLPRGIPIGERISIDLTAQHVPEPTALTLIAFGLAGLGYSRKKNTNQ